MQKKRKILRNNIRRLRFFHNEMSQVELGRALGCSNKMISALERGRAIPSILRAYKMAEFFGVPLEEVYYYEEVN